MRLIRLIAAVAMTLMLLGVPATAAAGKDYFSNPNPLVNHINRCLGIGWSDGYHAYGNRNSWTVTPRTQASYPRPYSAPPRSTVPTPAVMRPQIIYQQTHRVIVLPPPTPQRPLPR